MKKFVLALFILLLVSNVYADEALQNVQPSAPEVPNQVNTTGSDYLPNVIKQHEDVSVDAEQSDEIENVQDSGNVENVDLEKNQSDLKENSSQEDSIPLQNEEVNPINNDASDENIKNKSYTPPQSIENSSGTKVKKVKHKKGKKVKKVKPKYGKYKNADIDPYIQSWEEELKNENNDNISKPAQEKEEKKVYTQDDYEQAYRDMKVPEFSYVHGIDPDQYYDMKSTTWSPYPLLRLNSPLYFKTIAIQPGYYLLTPRQYKEDWYILFKEAGVVKYTIPVMAKDYTPEFYYRDNLKELDMTKSQRWQIKFLNAWGKYVKRSKRKPAIQTNVELTDLDNNFLLIEFYYGAHKYTTILRTEKY